jgi:hypothetical protein
MRRRNLGARFTIVLAQTFLDDEQAEVLGENSPAPDFEPTHKVRQRFLTIRAEERGGADDGLGGNSSVRPD